MDELTKQLKQLKLDAFLEHLENLLDQHPEAREAMVEMLTRLSEAEIASRRERRVQYRIQEAKFGQIQTVDSFDFAYNPSTRKLKNRYLKLLGADMTRQGLSALFVGGSGLGKTHLARALGYHFCQKGERVRFVTMGALALDLTTSDATGTLRRTMDRYTKPTFLVVDEVGYVRLRELESNLVFQMISQRYDAKRSTVVTTNRAFGEWNQIFHNDAMAHAILDRLVERSEVFYLEGKSYRETHRERLKT